MDEETGMTDAASVAHRSTSGERKHGTNLLSRRGLQDGPTSSDQAGVTTENNKHLHTTDKVKKLLREETGKHTEEGLVTASVGAPSESEVTQGLEVTLGKLMGSLARKRTAAGRPDALQEMTPAQLSDEKHTVQRILLHFEKIYGRPRTTADKEMMRPLYERYREVKKQLSAQHKTHSTTTTQDDSTNKPRTENTVSAIGEQTLPSITLLTSGLAHSLPLDSCPLSSSSSLLSHSAAEPHSSSLSTVPSISTASSIDRVTVRKKRATGREMGGGREDACSSGALSELYRLQEAALAEKKRVRKILRDFESQFMSTHGRAATKDDREPRQKEYQEYKAIKEQLLQLANEINKNTRLQKTL